MTTLKAEKRDMTIKAKALRRQGKVLGNIYGKDRKNSIPIQIDTVDATRFLKEHTKGSQAIVDLGDESINVQLKDVTFEPMKHQYDNVDFQELVAGETVTSTAQIVLTNTDAVVGYLAHSLSEISYKAIPSELVEKIEIDASKVAINTSVLVGDLDIAKNDKVELITPADTLILHVSEHQKGVMEATEETSEEA
ncbi:MAG: 50S ribosomal protein L25 [Lachnospiraceae bacterium]|nr:50S ribosomal protein L25 [Lachnospiraceae bacterium]MDD3616935.1 50S ribosomal protein L25 [Lachnospiraceae bacterium]